MTPWLDDGDVRVYEGDCVAVMRELPADSVDAVVCDPPYGLEFMGREWDAPWKAPAGSHAEAHKRRADEMADERKRRYIASAVNSYQAGAPFQAWCETWAREALRVLKPGGHLLAFGGTRTYHRLVCAIEDAGFEIRDSLHWLYGSGFPKSLDVSKAIDREAGAEREVVGEGRGRLIGGRGGNFNHGRGGVEYGNDAPTAPATPEAAAWQGWGTALKPSHEVVIAARKPESPSEEASTIGSWLEHLEAALAWLSVNAAAESSPSRPVDQAPASARWSAAELSSTRDALCARMGTSRFGEAARSCLSTVRSWRRILDALLSDPSTFTTGTASSTTTDWKTLRCCALALTPATTIEAVNANGGPLWDASPAARYLNAALSSLSATRELSALAPAIGEWLTRSRGGDASPTAHEPIVVARKPLAERTVARQVLATGTGGLNVDGCRVGNGGQLKWASPRDMGYHGGSDAGSVEAQDNPAGRWPPNCVFTHDAACEEGGACAPSCPVGELDRQSGEASYNPAGVFGRQRIDQPTDTPAPFAVRKEGDGVFGYGDRGGASRFFPTFRYEAKASGADRGEGNSHPTVKPLALMRWLCRLVTPPGGLVLDPFAGSGTTGLAARQEGFRAILIEREEEYLVMCAHRLRQLSLFA